MTAPQRFASSLARLAERHKGEDVVVLDVSELHSLIRCFVVVTARNERHAALICDEACREARALGDAPHHREEGGEWSCLDFFDVVLHVFSPEAREYYDFESLWADAPRIAWEAEAAPLPAQA
ncbi:MAG: ribosome silencing factor [Planctomycetota bacterium]|nr:MAG: ribosome silencing factor [Planctomycetota bacterium]